MLIWLTRWIPQLPQDNKLMNVQSAAIQPNTNAHTMAEITHNSLHDTWCEGWKISYTQSEVSNDDPIILAHMRYNRRLPVMFAYGLLLFAYWRKQKNNLGLLNNACKAQRHRVKYAFRACTSNVYIQYHNCCKNKIITNCMHGRI